MSKLKQSLARNLFRLFIVLIVFKASAALAVTCPTWFGGQLCDGGGKSWCYQNDIANGCQVEVSCSPISNGTNRNNCLNNTCVLNCNDGYVPCSSACQTPIAKPANCSTHDPCTGACTVCNSGYEWVSSACVVATLKLGVNSVSGSNVVQAASGALLYVNGTGVGVGTNNPSSSLHVVGVTTISDDLSMIGSKSIKLNSSSNTILYIGNYYTGGFAFGSGQTASMHVEGDVRANQLCIKDDCKSAWSEIQGTNYWTVSGDNIYSNNSGNVGIGTNNPLAKLHVAGTIRTNLSGTGNRCLYVTDNGDIAAKSVDCGTATGGDNLGDHSATQNLKLNNYWLSGDGGDEGIFVDGSGNVGIGTMNPLVQLNLTHNNSSLTGTVANNTIRFTDTDTTTTLNQPLGKIEFFGSDTTTPGAGIKSYILSSSAGTSGGGDFRFGVSSNAGTVSEAMRISSGGNLGIGTTSPDYKLAVVGDAYFNSPITVGFPTASSHAVTKNYIDGLEFDWTKLMEYPTACSDGQFISAIGDTLTCGTPTSTAYTAGSGLSLVSGAFSVDSTVVRTTGTQSIAGTKTFSTTPLTLSAVSANLIFSSTSGTKTITTGGTTSLNLNPGGNVGIGDDDPTTKLTVNGTISANIFKNSALANCGNGLIANASGEIDCRATSFVTTDQYWTGTSTNLNATTARTSLGLGSLALLSSVASSNITDGTIVNADISSSAAISASKISFGTGSAGQVWTSNSSGVGSWANPTSTAYTAGSGLSLSSNAFSLAASGSASYVTRWTSTNQLGYGKIWDNNINVGINTDNPLANANLQINAANNFEALRLISASAYSPLNIRNNANTADIFRVDQSGSLEVGLVPWARLTSFPTACPSGQYVTALGDTLTCGTPTGTSHDALTLGDIGTGDSQGASLDGQKLTLHAATASSGGVVTTGPQTFAGTKTFNNTIIGNISGSAEKATSLVANGTNCSAGYYPLGVDDQGNAESCTLLPTGGSYSADRQGIELSGNIFGLELDGTTLSKSDSGLKVNAITNNQISASAGIVDTKLATITTANKVSGSAVQLAFGGGLENSTGLKIIDGIYAKLAGVSGGQNLIGGTAANNTLTFQGNSAASGNTSTGINMSFKVGNSGGTNAMTILNNGNIGINRTAPTQKLHVTGNIDSYVDSGTGSIGFSVVDAFTTSGGQTAHYGLTKNSFGLNTIALSGWGGLGLFTGGSERLMINTTDSIGVNIKSSNGSINWMNIKSVSNLITLTVGDGGANSKLDVGTVDPIYTIDETRYATYMAGMTGVKEETSGALVLDKQSAGLFMAKIDFQNSPAGSDIWLFGRTANLINNQDHFDQTACLLTPNFAGQAWYEKDWASRSINIFARPDNDNRTSIEVSYRLTAPRFDSEKWTNYGDSEHEGFNLDKLLK